MKITQVRVERHGGHEHVTLWVDGKNVGTLTLGLGEGAELVGMLTICSETVIEVPAIEVPARK